MAVTRYAGDRFVIGGSDNEPTGVLDGAYLINTGDLAQKVLRNGSWVALSGAGGGGSANPGTPLNSVQFNSSSTFAGNANLTFTDGNRLNVNKLGISGNVYDSNNSLGEGGMVLTNEGQTGVNWKSIESVLSGVGGSGVTNYVARWSDEDTLTSGTIYDDGDVGIGTANPGGKLHIFSTTVADMVILESTHPSAFDAPDLIFYRNSSSPADLDDLGILKFRGRNDPAGGGGGVSDINYAQIESQAISVTDGGEGGALNFHTYENGSSAKRVTITGSNLGIGTASPYRKLHVNGDAIISGKFYDVTNSTGDKGYVLTSDDNGPVWAASGDFDGLSGNLVATGAIIDGISGNLITTGQTLTSEINTVSGNLIATGAIVDDISGNLITTGQTLTNNLIATGAIVDSVSGNLITTGQTLTTNINTVATNLIATGAVIDDVSGNLIQTGQYLTDEIAIVSGLTTGGSAEDFTALSGALIATGAIIDDVSGNLITTGQTLTTNINTVSTNLVATGAIVDDISGNLITTGQTLTTNINTVSTNLIATGAIVDDISGNLITTGQTLTNEIAIVSGLVATGAIDGSGVANYVARWSDQDTITSGVIQDNGTAVGINQAADPNNALTIKSIENNSNPLQIAAHDGDSLFVFRQTDGDARLSLKKDGGVEEIRLESDADSWIKGGNLGIGTVGAGAKLESYISAGGEKALRLNSNFAGGNTVDFIPAIVGISNAGFSIDLAGTNRLVINSDGNVGIGTNAPAAKLDLRSSDSVVAYIIRPSASPTLHIGSATSAGAQIGYIHTNDYAFFGHDADHDAIVVNSNGNVGVGTTNPGSRLETSGTFRSTHPGTSPTAGVGIEVLYKPLDERGYIYTYDRDSNLYKTTRIGSDTYFTADGNVGFGTAIAEHDLHVNGSAIISGKLYDQTNSTGDKGYVLTSDDNGPLWKASGDFDGLSGNLVATGAIVDDISGNLITTGQTLQTQITANDGDISTLTTNLITTGQTLTSEIAIVSGLATGGSAEDFAALSGALIATGAIVDDVSGNLITTGQTLQTQITANDGDISTLTTNLITTGQTLTSEIGIVSGLTVTNANNLVSTGAVVDDISGNLITTGQTLTSEIAIVSGLVSTGALDGSGVANYSAKWLDGNTVTSGVIYDDGDVGISTSSPDAKLHVFDSTVADLAIFETNNPNSSNGPDVVLYRSSASPADADDLGRIAFRGRNDADEDINYANVIGEAIDVSDGNEDGALRFNTYLTGVSTETMVLRSANVGIGTATPAELLEISATGDAAMQFQSTATSLSGGETIGAIKFKNNDSSGTDPHICGTIASIAETQYGRAGLAFSTGRTSEFAERMRIRYDGNVGIGIDAPVAKLHVSNSASSGGTFKFTDGSSRTLMDLGGGVLSWNAASVLGAGAWAGTADHEIKTLTTTRDTVLIVGPSSGTNHALYVTGLKSYFAGSVGIGTDVPATDLEVYKSSGAVQIYANSNSIIARLAVTGAGLGAVGTSSNADFVIQRNGTTKITVASALTTMVGEVLITTGSTSVRTLSGVLKVDTIENNSGASNLKLQTESGGNKHIEITPDGTGNVGIGTAAPTSPLTIKSSSTSATDSGLTIQGNSNTNAIVKIAEKSTDGARLHLYDGGVEKIAFYTDGTANHISAGSVGIGTNNPSKIFEVYHSQNRPVLIKTVGSYNSFIEMDSNRSSANSYTGGIVGKWNGTETASIYFRTGSDTTNKDDGYITFQTAPAGSISERMRITSSGLVGIGTDTPSCTLQGNGTNGGIIGVTRTTANTTGTIGHFRFGADLANVKGIQDGATDSARLEFETQATGGSATARLTIKSDGVVDINSAKLKINGGSGTDGQVLTTDGAGGIAWETSPGAGSVDGSGTANYVAKWSDSDTIANSVLRDDGNRLAVGAAPSLGAGILHLKDVTSNQAKVTLESANAYNSWINFSAASNEMSIGYDKSTVGGFVFSNSDTIASNIRMVILSGGSVGIGTDAPGQLLHVYKAGVLEPNFQSTTGRVGLQLNAGAAGDVSWILYSGYPAAGDFNIRESGVANHFVIKKTTGSVGIGNDSPSFKLQVNGDIRINSGTAFLDDGQSIRWGGTAAKIDGSSGGDYLRFYTDGVERMRIISGGAVGIGTATPNAAGASTNNSILSLKGKAAAYGGILELINHGTSGDGQSLGLVRFLDNTTENAQIEVTRHSATDDANMQFKTRPAGGSLTTRLTIADDGNVGIGTETPGAPLHLFSNGSANTQQTVLCLGSNTSNRPSLQFSENQNAGFDTGMSIEYRGDFGAGGANGLTINGLGADATTSGAAIATFLSGGSVGIGTTGPDSKLEIAGGGYNSSLKIKGGASHTGIQFEDSDGNTDGYVYAISDTIGFLDAGADWTIQSKNDDYIRFSTNGNTEHMRIKSDGKVGIGTDAPGSLLTVSGNSDDGDAACTIAINDEDSTVGSKLPAIQFYGGGTTQGRIRGGDAAFQIAVGSSPTTALNINTANGYPSFTYGSQVRLTLGSAGTAETNTANWIRGTGANLEFNAASGDFNWEVGGVHRMRLTDTGFLGIGLGAGTDPFGQLHVNGTNGSNIHITRTSGGTTSTFGSIIFGNTNIDSSCAEITGDQDGTNDSGRLEFGTQASVVGGVVTRLTIKGDGNVGIGTDAPAQLLHVNGGSDANLRLTSASNRSGVFIDKPGTSTIMGSALVLSSDETYRLGTASYYHVVMQQGGTVSLNYQGNTKLNTTSGGVTVTGTLTETSSITLKENVETYTPSLDIINKIRPVKYNRKTNKDKKEIGLIAEELAELFPELVEKDEKGNPSSVNYSRAVTVLLGGFKELYKEIEELKKRI